MQKIIHTWDPHGLSNIQHLHKEKNKFSRIILYNAPEWAYHEKIAGHDNGIQELLKITKENNIQLEIINGTTKEAQLLLELEEDLYKIYHWENHWLCYTYYNQSIFKDNLILSSNLDIDDNSSYSNFNYKVISLNNKPHTHRCLMMDLLSKYKIIDNNAISWHERKYHSEQTKNQLTSIARGYPWKYWTPKVLTLTDNYKNEIDQNILPKEYKTSFCQLVIESTTDVPFITEKTSMPLFFMKPFIVASCVNFHSILKRMGFKLYEEIFDYDFDSMTNDKKRFDEIAKNLAKINYTSKRNIIKLYELIYDKLLYNKNHAIFLATNKSLQPDILEDAYNLAIEDDATQLDDLKFIFENLSKT